MTERIVAVTLKEGLHARPATEFVKAAGKFSAQVQVGKNGKFVDGKSILGLMSMAVSRGEEITLRVTGDDEDVAVETLAAFLLEGDETC